MADDTLPPVGATVTDGFGQTWTREEQAHGPNEQPEPGWWRPCSFGHHCADGDKDADLTALWRMQQESDGLKARVAELEQEMALRQHLYDVHPGPDTEELAAFRALAVEAFEDTGVADDGYIPRMVDRNERLAAHAPKEASHE